MNASNVCTVLQQNTDISGIGVRLSFYIQTFVLGQYLPSLSCTSTSQWTSQVLLVNRSSEEASGSLWTLISLSFGLTIAALAAVGSDSLTLYEAIQVMKCLSFLRSSKLLSY